MTPTAMRCGSGCYRARPAGFATSISTGSASTPCTRSSTRARPTSSPRSPPASTRSIPRALVIAESGLNDPRVIRPAGDCGWGCDAQWADDFHHALRVLLTGERDGYYAEFGSGRPTSRRPSTGRSSTTASTRTFRARRFGAKADDRPPEQFVVFAQDHDQVGNRAFGDRLPARRAAAGGVLHAAVAVHADALHGRGVRRGRSIPVLLRPHRQADRQGDAGRAGGAEFASFASFGEEMPDPQALETFERSKLTRRPDAGPRRALP